MKQQAYIRITNPAPLLCLFIFLMSCIAEKEYFDPEDPQPPGEEIAFTLKMPVETATTRALE
ncbi:MAG: hypothetical protein LIP04_06290 [Tannerellaceae bacterium]|nr:hypothetical protein [Tannerellaceae bacterium]